MRRYLILSLLLVCVLVALSGCAAKSVTSSNVFPMPVRPAATAGSS